MKLSNLVMAGALSLASVTSFAAGGPLDLSSGSAGFSSTPVAGGFLDEYTFTLGTPSVATGSITSVVSGTQDVDFLAIYLIGSGGVFSFTQLLGDPVEVWSLPATTLAAGSYTLALVGTNSASIGSYGGNLGVSPVPEPETYALFFAGLGAIGFMIRRRNNS